MSCNTLLAGFGPFGAVVSNPAERVTRHFMDAPPAGFELTCLVLPVTYSTAFSEVEQSLREEEARGRPIELLLLLGAAVGSDHWRVERSARNRVSARPDAAGELPAATEIEPGGPARLETTADVEALAGALRSAGLHARVSDDAGAYLCNFAYYRALHGARASRRSPTCLFLHLPADTETLASGQSAPARFTFDQQVTAVTTVLRALMHSPDLASSPPPEGELRFTPQAHDVSAR